MSSNTTPPSEWVSKTISAISAISTSVPPISTGDAGLKEEPTLQGPFELAIQSLPKHLLKPLNATGHQTTVSNNSKERFSFKGVRSDRTQNSLYPLSIPSSHVTPSVTQSRKTQVFILNPTRTTSTGPIVTPASWSVTFVAFKELPVELQLKICKC